MTDDSCLVTVVGETECDSPKLDLEFLTTCMIKQMEWKHCKYLDLSV